MAHPNRPPLANLTNQIPNPPLPGPVHNPIIAEDVSKRVIYTDLLRKRKMESDDYVTDQELVDAEVHTASIVSEFSGGANAPAWFAPALQNALQPAVQAALQDALQPAIQLALQAALQPAIQAVVNPRFTALDNQLAAVENRLNNRIGGVENRLVAVENRLGVVENQLAAVENRLGVIENRIGVVENQLVAVENRLDAVENRLDAVENRLDVMDTKISNSSATVDEDEISPPREHPPPRAFQNFPRTLGTLRRLQSADMKPIERYYGLNSSGTEIARSKRIFRKYGIQFVG